ncbi:hypothetical protein N2152v2_007207 [Parachlorella kessleri]
MQLEGDKPGPFQAGALLRLRGVAQCQVNGCANPLPSTPLYYKKFRVCPAHASVKELDLAGWRVRFCQQCGRFQQLADFDGDRKSCRASLAKHNARRTRKASDAARKCRPAASLAGVCASKGVGQGVGRTSSGASSATPSSPSLSEGKPCRIASLPSPTAEPHAAPAAAAAAQEAAAGGSPAKRRQQQGAQPPPQQAQQPHDGPLQGAGLSQLQARGPHGPGAQEGEPAYPIKREAASPPTVPGGLLPAPWDPAAATSVTSGDAAHDRRHSGPPPAGDWDALCGLASLVEQLVDSGAPQQPPPPAAAAGPAALPAAAPALGAAGQPQRPAARRPGLAAAAGPPGAGSKGAPAGLLDLLRLAESTAAVPHHAMGRALQLSMFQQQQQPQQLHHLQQPQQPYSPMWAAVQPAMFMPPPRGGPSGGSGQREGSAHPVAAFRPSSCPVGAWLEWLQYGGPAAQAVGISQRRPVPFQGPPVEGGGRGVKRAYPEGAGGG